MSKQKLTIEKVVNKSFILWGKSYDINTINILFKPNINIKQYNKLQYMNEFVIVDYDKNKREWYITYFNYGNILSCTIDDISGTYAITSF